MPALRDELLKTGLIDGHFVLASGRHARQKFDFDHIANNPQLLQQTAEALADLIHQHFPETKTILTVANGANILAAPISSILNIDAVTSRKDEAKNFFVDEVVEGPYLIVDDVFTKGTNVGKLLGALPKEAELPQALIVVLNRHTTSQDFFEYVKTNIPVVSLIQYPMTDLSPAECDCGR